MPMDPLLGLRGAMDHPLASQRLSFEAAVRHYTASGAEAVSRPFGRGRLAPGEPADFILLHLPVAPPVLRAEDLTRVRILATWVAGILVHADPAVGAFLPSAL